MTFENFLEIATYGNANWKGNFTEDEIRQNAEDYYAEWEYSNKQGKATFVMEGLCKLLIDDIEGGSEEARDFLDLMMMDTDCSWACDQFCCEYCNKKEIYFFTNEELENLQKHMNHEMLIQNALPTKPNWVRETFVSGRCMCPTCWNKYWNGELH